MRGARIGVARKKYTGYNTSVDAHLESALAVMKERGATIVDPADIATAGKFDDDAKYPEQAFYLVGNIEEMKAKAADLTKTK